ncbi:MAG TPA: hypothetical protein VHX59_16235 [Mycobacteriales bacterium]|nr:hypothetical protein [Mycobacteriales bacterium]
MEFTEEQQRELARAMHEAQIAVLKAITRAAEQTDMHAASRATERLTHALMLVRAAAGQGPAGFPFFHGPGDFDEDDEP